MFEKSGIDVDIVGYLFGGGMGFVVLCVSGLVVIMFNVVGFNLVMVVCYGGILVVFDI